MITGTIAQSIPATAQPTFWEVGFSQRSDPSSLPVASVPFELCSRGERQRSPRGPKYGFSDFGPEITRDATKRIVCSSANTFMRSRVYFHYGCGTMRACAAARSPYKPYKPCLALLPSPPPKRGRRGTRGPAGSSTLPPRHARTADGRERSLAAPWSSPARDAEESASAPPTTHL